MDEIQSLMHGFGVALTPTNLALMFIGVLLGGIEYFTSNTVSIKGEASYHLISNADGFAGRGPRNPDGFKLTIGLKKYF